MKPDLEGSNLRRFELFTRCGISPAYNRGGYEEAKRFYEEQRPGRSFDEDYERAISTPLKGDKKMRPKNWTELGQGEEVEFDVHCKMKKCWANEFLSMLMDMERLGNMGCSRMRGMYCDGDGDYRPKFTHNLKDFTETEHKVSKEDPDMWFWDAG